MKRIVVIVADTGQLKAYRVEELSLDEKGPLELVQRRSYKFDRKSHYGHTGGPRNNSRGSGDARSARRASGDQHHTDTELELKAVRTISADINTLLRKDDAEAYCLALPRSIWGPVNAKVDKRYKDKIRTNLPVNLTKATVAALRERFGI